MARLTHTHHIMKENPGSHSDSRGVSFGEDEHVKAAEGAEFPEGIAIIPVTHSHLHIREFSDETTLIPRLHYEPPSDKEEEIVKPPRVKATA